MSDNLDEWEFYKNGDLYHKVMMDANYADSAHNAHFLIMAEALKQSRQQILNEVLEVVWAQQDHEHRSSGMVETDKHDAWILKEELTDALKVRFGNLTKE